MDTFDIVSGREKGENIPLSIGTAQAMEALSGLGDFDAKEAPILKYTQVWVNLRTLFRNFFNALGIEARATLSPDALLVGLQEDLLIIQSCVSQASRHQTSVVFYHCSFEHLEREFPNARYKTLSTQKQKEEQQKEDDTLALFLAQDHDATIECYDVKITGTHPKVVMLTHYPVDLLWYRQFDGLDLVESHTGKIKARPSWHTKLTGGKNLSHLPFNRMTIQLYGDGNVLFASMIKSVKDEITKLAKENRWHSLTTNEKVRHDISKIYDPRVKQFYRSLF